VVHRAGQQVERHLVCRAAARRVSFASSSSGTCRFIRQA
jgi:hypothetical protein